MERNSDLFIRNNMFDIWKSRITYTFLIYCFILLIIEIVFRNVLFKFSLPVIVFIQQHFGFLSVFAHLFSFYGTANGIIFFVIVTYNFANCYKTLILMSIGLFGSYFGGLLKIIYASPRPYWASQEITALGCEGGWGNPSNHALISVSFYMTLYRIVIDSSHIDMSKKTKNNYLKFTILFIVLICFSRIFLGVHSINQVLFGAAIGLFIYYFLFHILCLNTNNPNELISIILSYKYISFFVILLSFVPFFPYWIINVNAQLKNKWKTIIESQCPNLPHSKRFEQESFLCTYLILTIIPCLLGMYFEYSYIFDRNYAKWARYNFDPYNDSDKNLLYKSELKKTCWNCTDYITSIKRIILIGLIVCFIMIPHFLVSYHDSFGLIITIKMLLPMTFLSFFMFSYLKMLCSMLQLTNIVLFTQINTPHYSGQDRDLGIRDLVNDFI